MSLTMGLCEAPDGPRAPVAWMLALVLGASALGRSPGGPDVFPLSPTVRSLDNGLKVVLVPFDSPGIVAYYTVVRTGSRNEVEPGQSGFAHFFEHMMFRGTDRFCPRRVQRAVLASSGAIPTPTPPTTSPSTTRWLARTALEQRDRPRVRPLHEPQVLGVGLQAGVEGGARRVQQERLRPREQALREGARHGVHDAHLQAHHHGLHRRHRGHAQPVRVQPASSSSATTRRATASSWWSATSTSKARTS